MVEKPTSLPAVLPGHWTTPAGFEIARQYERATRERLPFGHQSDLELAHTIFMEDSTSLGMIAMQTAAKERIRWLSVQLALSNLRADAAKNHADDMAARLKVLEAALGEIAEAKAKTNAGTNVQLIWDLAATARAALAQETPHECDHVWMPIDGGRQCQKCKGVDLDKQTCGKCGAKAVVFICNQPGCPVNGGSAHD